MNKKNDNNKNFLILYKNNGKFYNVYGDDAYILNYLFGYKVLDNNKCGFPDNVINKVINKLDEKHISYQIIEINKDPVIKDYKKLNKYTNILKESLANITKKEQIDRLIEKIKSASPDTIDKIMDCIEKCLE